MASVFFAIQSHDWSRARSECERLLSHEPDSPDALHALSVICWSQGEPEMAIRHLQDALRIRSHPTWYNNLGVLYGVLHKWDDAAQAFRRALDLQPQDEDALLHLGLAVCAAGDPAAAIEIFSKVVRARSDNVEAWIGLGQAFFTRGDAGQAYPVLRQAVELDPSARARQHLVRTCIVLRRFSEALEHARKFCELHPSPESYVYLAVALSETGEIEEALGARDKAFSFGITDAKLHSSLLCLAQYDPQETGASLVTAHQQWALTHCPVWPPAKRFQNSPDPKRKLRVGFVAAELLTTPARYFRLPLLRSLSRDLFDVYVYNLSFAHTGDLEIPGTQREFLHRSDDEAVEKIIEDQIDVLVDCSGHQSYGRPRIFALRAAPVQVAYSGYPGTTGVRSMDCLFTDSVLSPAGSEKEYSEPLFRLGGGRFLYAPPVDAPVVAPLPAASNHHITFGVFQTGAKLNAHFWSLAADVLHAVPRSRLLIHHGDPSYDEPASCTVHRIRAKVSEFGVSGDRIHFVGGREHSEHLAVLSSVDVALDTLPFNGHATTCECLWMGVPVLARVGVSHVGRVSAGLLTQVGCGDWIARSDSECVDLARHLAEDIEKLASYRTQLRGKMSTSPLTDVRARTLEFESACRTLWQEWCSGAQGRRSAEEL